jgi:hypothetical protein
MKEEDDIDRTIEYLIEIGAIEINGFDPVSEQMTYALTPKCKEVLPELFEEHFAYVNQMTFDMWQKGYIEMRFDEAFGPMVMIKDEEFTRSLIPTLPDDERFFMQNLLEAYMSDKE